MALDLNLTEIGKIAIPAIIVFIGGVFFELIRGRREKKNRFHDEKRSAYSAYIRVCDLLLSDIRLVAGLTPKLKRLTHEVITDGDANSMKAHTSRMDSTLERLQRDETTRRELIGGPSNELWLLAPRSARPLAYVMLLDLDKLGALLNEYRAGRLSDAEWEKKLIALEGEYKRAREEFRAHAQRDLGLRI